MPVEQVGVSSSRWRAQGDANSEREPPLPRPGWPGWGLGQEDSRWEFGPKLAVLLELPKSPLEPAQGTMDDRVGGRLVLVAATRDRVGRLVLVAAARALSV